MRSVIWFVLLFGAAVVAASTLGANDGLVSVYAGTWRFDVSLNLFLLLLVGSCFALVSLIHAANSLIGLPERARLWRVARRERTAQAALREALAQYFGGRYSRAKAAAQHALAIQDDTPELKHDTEFSVLGRLLAAGSAHRLQDRAQRDEHLARAFQIAQGNAAARSAEEGARLLAAEWAIDDRDAPRSLGLLTELPPGVARRTQALRLKLQATRLGLQPQEALKTARLLVKHQGLSKAAGQGLLRSLAFECLDTAHDIDQLKRTWMSLDAADRRDAFVASRAAVRAAQLGSADDGRSWLRPGWDRIEEATDDERAALSHALVCAVAGIGVDWLPRLESARQAFPRDAAVAHAVGTALAERQLWGKARQLLEIAAADSDLPVAAKRMAWLTLARLAENEGQPERAAASYRSAATLK
ncbi:MAG: heme biosynthesis HemY N-terminal domain-containing protein [Pseudomonadota bacterium]|nr:heme biosynthesis HemY N-terminal domain-containing protein [Pseudomonadota bacterium]